MKKKIIVLFSILIVLGGIISFFWFKKEKLPKVERTDFLGAIISFFWFKKFPKVERTELQLAHPELKIEDLVIGKGERAEKGKKLTVHYIGKLEDGTIFDSTYDKGRTFSFVLGQGRVIQGWEIGIEGMREGGKRKLTIPPHLGYGESGVRGMIPPNSTIIFEIELIDVE